MRVRNLRLTEVGIAVVGLAVLVYGETFSSRVVRIAVFVVVTLCVVAAAILSAFKDEER